MDTPKLPVIAAIPNFNMAQSLKELLTIITKLDYDAIYVLDDASTDTSAEIVATFPTVHFITSPINRGSAAARNLILNELKGDALIHFLDADVMLETKNPAQHIQELHLTEKSGFVGGLVLTESGKQDKWNYGPRLSLASTLSLLPYLIISPLQGVPFLGGLLSLFPNRPQGLKRRQVAHPYWVLESNLIIHSETLRQLGSFDEKLREHDIQPIAAKSQHQHRHNGFCESIIVTRSNRIKVRKYNRFVQLIKSELYVIRTHIGWKKYLSFSPK